MNFNYKLKLVFVFVLASAIIPLGVNGNAFSGNVDVKINTFQARHKKHKRISWKKHHKKFSKSNKKTGRILKTRSNKTKSSLKAPSTTMDRVTNPDLRIKVRPTPKPNR